MSNIKRPIPQGKSKSRGFTLIELVIVIVILGILAGVGIAYIGKLRADAKDTLATATGKQLVLGAERACIAGTAADGATALAAAGQVTVTEAASYLQGCSKDGTNATCAAIDTAGTAPTFGAVYSCATGDVTITFTDASCTNNPIYSAAGGLTTTCN